MKIAQLPTLLLSKSNKVIMIFDLLVRWDDVDDDDDDDDYDEEDQVNETPKSDAKPKELP